MSAPSGQSPDREAVTARLAEVAVLKKAIEETFEKYRDFPREDLTSGQFAAQVLLAILVAKEAQ